VALPCLEPFHLFARTAEELHLHLFELAHTEDKLASHNLVAEGLAYLSDAERYLHTACLLYVEEVYKDTLGGLRTEVHLQRTVGGRSHLCREHQVELSHIRPVCRSRYRVDDTFVHDNLTQTFQVVVVHGLLIAFVQRVSLCLVFQHTGIRRAVFFFVESVAVFLAGLLHLFVHLVIIFGYLVFDEHVAR
jgi:hypothetical protein